MSLRSLMVITTLLLISISVNAQESQAYLKAGNKLAAEEKYEAAIREYELVTASENDSYARALYNIGVCYFELYLTDKAVEYFNNALDLRRGNYPRASYALGVALEEQGRLVEANAAYSQAARESHDEFAAANFRRGVIAAKAGQMEAAANLFRNASKHPGPHVANSLNNLGVTLAQTGKLAEAADAFTKALRQSNGAASEAEKNLRLCRVLLLSAVNRDTFPALRLSLTEH